MNQLRHPQCRFCAAMDHADGNQRNLPFYQLKTYSSYNNRPLLYCYDMTQRPIHDNYITYCNVLNNFSNNNEPQYVQVIDSSASHGMVQFCAPPSNDSTKLSNQNNSQIKLLMNQTDKNCGVVLCTCKDFLNSNIPNRTIYDSLPGRNVDRHDSSMVTAVAQSTLTRDSIDSYEKSIDDQRDNSIYSNGSVLSDPMCRFCHLTKNTQADQLISPCYCCGTLKYVHQSCLKTWLEVSKKQRENSGNKPPHCELCNFKYVRKRKFQFGKIRQPKLSQNDCALHLIFLCSLLVMVTSASVTILCFAMEKSASKSNRIQSYEKVPEATLKFSEPKPGSEMSESGNLLCDYLSNLNLKDYSHSQRESASKLSVMCDLMLKKDLKPPRGSSFDLSTISSDVGSQWKKGGSRNPPNRVRLWLLRPEEAVTLASGVIFFIAFFIAMMVQVKSSYTCYQLVTQWVRLNYTNEVQSLQLTRKSTNIEMKTVKVTPNDPRTAPEPREYIERCVTEI